MNMILAFIDYQLGWLTLHWYVLFSDTVGSLTRLRLPSQPDFVPLDFRFCDIALLSTIHSAPLKPPPQTHPPQLAPPPALCFGRRELFTRDKLVIFFSCTSRMIKKVSDFVFGLLSGCWARPRAQVTTNKV